MIDEEAAADGRSGVDLDAGEESAELGNEARQDGNTGEVQPVSEPMEQDRVEAGVTQDDLQHALGGWIFPEYGVDLFPDRTEHTLLYLFPGPRANRGKARRRPHVMLMALTKRTDAPSAWG